MDWTLDFFDATYQRLWGFPGLPSTASDLARLDTLLPSPPARVLDVGCGEGRHAIALAQRGYDVIGVDISEPFLATARERAAAARVLVDFRRIDMRAQHVTDCAAVICLGNSFGYGEERDNGRALAGMVRSLHSGGVIVVEVLDRERIVGAFVPRSRHVSAHGVELELQNAFDRDTGILTITHAWRDATGEHRRVSRQRLYTRDELVRLFADHALVDVELRDAARRIWVIGRSS